MLLLRFISKFYQMIHWFVALVRTWDRVKFSITLLDSLQLAFYCLFYKRTVDLFTYLINYQVNHADYAWNDNVIMFEWKKNRISIFISVNLQNKDQNNHCHQLMQLIFYSILGQTIIFLNVSREQHGMMLHKELGPRIEEFG